MFLRLLGMCLLRGVEAAVAVVFWPLRVAVAAVVAAQNELTQKVLSQCETREQFK